MPMLIARRKVRIPVDTISPTGAVNWSATVDVDGNRIPKKITITDILITPTASTIRGFRIFTKESRIISPANANYSRIYEDTWAGATTASDEQTTDRPANGISYEDEDASDERTGTIWGDLRLKTAATNSAFIIDIWFKEGG